MTHHPAIHKHLLDGYAARAQRRAAPVQKHWQAAFGYAARSTVSRQYNGEAPSEATRALRTIETLATSTGCSPWPLIAESIVVARDAELREYGTLWLEHRLQTLTDQSFGLTAAAHRMAMHGERSRPEQAEANLRAAELLLEIAAIQRILHERERGA